MPADTVEITGGLSAAREEGEALRLWLAFASTGEEYGRQLALHRESHAALWGVQRPRSPLAALEGPIEELQGLALALASRQPFVVQEPVEAIQLTDDLVEDARRTTGLTYGQIAEIF